MKLHRLYLVFLISTPVLLQAADPVVTNVVSVQRAGTKLVDITFDVADADSDPLVMSVQISDDSGTTFTVPVSALSGDTSVAATPAATSKALVWDARIDFNQQFNNTMVVRVIASDGGPTGPPPAGMVWIPEGAFQMGDQTASGTEDESPAHTVTVSGFYLDQFEVTKSLWEGVKTYADANGYVFTNPGAGQGAFHPVHSVDWYDAVKWCNARSEKAGLTPVYYTDEAQTIVFRTGTDDLAGTRVKWAANGYRLPTEAEWEKAARGGLVAARFPWGSAIDANAANYLNTGDPFEAGSTPKTSPVGYYDGGQLTDDVDQGNGYGLYDMAGNVNEWCWDRYVFGWYTDPEATSDDTRGPVAGIDRVVRGGSWTDPSDDVRCASRLGFVTPTEVNISLGFRSARGR